MTTVLLFRSTPSGLPFSVRVTSTNAKCVSGLSVVVPVVPTSVLALEESRLLTKVVSLIVRN